jgi:hypothetical protein
LLDTLGSDLPGTNLVNKVLSNDLFLEIIQDGSVEATSLAIILDDVAQQGSSVNIHL